jgi:hypothetical protein
LLRAGHSERHDYEFERCGVVNLFLAFELLAISPATKLR